LNCLVYGGNKLSNKDNSNNKSILWWMGSVLTTAFAKW